MLTILQLVLSRWRCAAPLVADTITGFLLDWYQLTLSDVVTSRVEHPGALRLMLNSPQLRPRCAVYALYHWSVGSRRALQDVNDAIDNAAYLNRLPQLQLLVEYAARFGTPYFSSAMRRAARYGHLKMVRWLFETWRRENDRKRADQQDNEMYGVDDAIGIAAENGHLGVLAFLCDHQPVRYAQTAASEAVKLGHLDIVMYLGLHKMIQCARCVQDAALLAGQVHMMPWLEALQTGDLCRIDCG